MNIGLLTGIAASIGTGLSLVPQLIKICKEKKPADISYKMLAVLMAGLILWVCYGVIHKDWIIIVSNAFSIMVNTAIIYFNLHYRK